MYKVKLEQFQGPLDLLLQLTEEKKLDITEISLAKVTDQYLTYLKNSEVISLDDLADFLIIASRLILIKSRMLLPTLELSKEEEQDIETLKRQLEEYKKFKNLAKKLEEIAKDKNIAYSREKYFSSFIKKRGFKPVFYPPKNLGLEDLKGAFEKIMKEVALLEKKLPEKSLQLKISIEEKIKKIQKELLVKTQIVFQNIGKKNDSRIDIIINFLALLELIKQSLVRVKQNKAFEEIIISKI